MSRGESGFQEFYQKIYGDRWSALFAEMSKPGPKTKMKNPFFDLFPGAGLFEFYELDPASVIVAEQVMAAPGEKILDLCASPGGKSLAMIFSVFAKKNEFTDGFLTVNDLSHDRVQRLRRVLGEYLPSELLKKIRITCHDGSKWGLYEQEIYDKILLDAPCSGERHLVEDKKAMADWTPKRSKGLQQRQYALLCSAFMALKKGGTLVYSTCSLSPLENQDLLKKFHKRSGDEFTFINEGTQIFPDETNGAGPMFYAVLRKN